jgi:dynein heavy chain
MTELTRIHSYYKFSLDSFVIVVKRAIDIVAAEMNPKKEEKEPEEGEEGEQQEEGEEAEPEMTPRTLKVRVERLVESITYQAFNYVRRGTFERHKLIIASMLCLRINTRKGLIDEKEVNALIKKEVALETTKQPDSLNFL